jgi:subtilase family serine protease
MRIAAFVGLLLCIGVLIGFGAPGAEEMVQLSGNHPIGIVGEPTGDIAPERTLKMTITLKLSDPDALNRLLSEQQDPASPNFHRWLTPQQFNAQFGPDPVQFKAVHDWLAANEFEIVAENLEQRSITFTGGASQAERVFRTKIVTYAGDSYANVTDPYIPAQFANVIGAIGGLDNMMRTVPLSSHSTLRMTH